jgi:precorrin-6B methylase 2
MQLTFHRDLLADRTTQEAFRAAIFQVVGSEHVVLDLGTGTGIHALFACQADARRVYAVEQSPIVGVARDLCLANGFADRVTVIERDAVELELPEQVDVIVAHQGIAELFNVLPTVRDRCLKAGGAIVPSSVELFAAPLDAEAAYDETVGFWAQSRYGLTFECVRSRAVNSNHEWHIDAGEVLSEPLLLGRYDLSQVRAPRLLASAEVEIVRSGMVHGLGLFVTQTLADGIKISPGFAGSLSSRSWSNTFLPLQQPVAVHVGDRVQMHVRTGTGGWGKFWNWAVGARDRGGREKGHCSHSTWDGFALSKNRLWKQDPRYTPELGSRGEALRFVVNSFDGSRSVGWIEEELLARHPGQFNSRREASVFVADIVSRYAASGEEICSTASAI